jgi:hypothetical protein
MVQPSTFLLPLLALTFVFFLVFANPIRVAAAIVRGGAFSVCTVHFATIFLLPLAFNSTLSFAFVLYLVWPAWWLFTRRMGLVKSGGRVAALLTMSLAWLLFAPSACTGLALSLGAKM